MAPIHTPTAATRTAPMTTRTRNRIRLTPSSITSCYRLFVVTALGCLLYLNISPQHHQQQRLLDIGNGRPSSDDLLHSHTASLSLSSSQRIEYFFHAIPNEGAVQTQQRQHGSSSSTIDNSHKNNHTNIPIFYNLYIGNESDVGRVSRIVQEQLDLRDPTIHYPIFVQSIGYRTDIDLLSTSTSSSPHTNAATTTLIGHHTNGTEMITLRSLWEYCQQNPHSKVVYLHSKGSYKDNPSNSRLRRFVTYGALSKECATGTPGAGTVATDTSVTAPTSHCNVCSSRFSPVPHPHTSGNMWLAECSYVQHLIDPAIFQSRMESLFETKRQTSSSSDDDDDDNVDDNDNNNDGIVLGEQSCDGRGRYAAEHWIHSHPSVVPCDLYTDRKFTWGYHNVPFSKTFRKKLMLAPRFDLRTYIRWPECAGRGTSLDQRLTEYAGLYDGERPGPNWFGWTYYPKNKSTESISSNSTRTTMSNQSNEIDDDHDSLLLPYYLLYWQWLSPDMKQAAKGIGYDHAIWNNLRHPPSIEGRSWHELSVDVRHRLTKLGYKADSWDERLSSPPTVEKESTTGLKTTNTGRED